MIVEVKPKTRCINLTAFEARAFQRGATILVRECEVQPRPPVGVTIQLHSLDNGQFGFFDDDRDYICPLGRPGDLLIGREAWFAYEYVDYVDGMLKRQVAYRADGEEYRYKSKKDRWRSAAVMPSNFARVRRIVSAVSLKRCQELTEGECEAMGYSGAKHYLGHGDFEEVSPAEQFAEANAKLWGENKFVWVTSVKEEA